MTTCRECAAVLPQAPETCPVCCARRPALRLGADAVPASSAPPMSHPRAIVLAGLAAALPVLLVVDQALLWLLSPS